MRGLRRVEDMDPDETDLARFVPMRDVPPHVLGAVPGHLHDPPALPPLEGDRRRIASHRVARRPPQPGSFDPRAERVRDRCAHLEVEAEGVGIAHSSSSVRFSTARV